MRTLLHPFQYLLIWIFFSFGASIAKTKHQALKDDEYNTKGSPTEVMVFLSVNNVRFLDFSE